MIVRQRSSKTETALLIGLAVLLIGLYTVLLLFPSSSRSEDGGVSFITVNTWQGPLYLLTFATGVAALFFSIRALRGDRRIGLVPLVFVLGSPIVCCLGFASELMTHTDVASIRDRDGTEYHLFAHSTLQSSELAIVRRVGSFAFLDRFETLAISSGERGEGVLAVVRPQGSTDDPGLFLTPNRQLVGGAYGGLAFLAYGLEKNYIYTEFCDQGAMESCGPMSRLSPFLLLRDNDLPIESDFKATLHPAEFGRANAEVVQAELQNPNPRVASMAKRLLTDLRAHPPDR